MRWSESSFVSADLGRGSSAYVEGSNIYVDSMIDWLRTVAQPPRRMDEA